MWDGCSPWRSQYFKSPHLRKQYSDKIHFQGQTQEPYFELDPTLHPSASLPPPSQRTKLTAPGAIMYPVRMPTLLFLSRWVSTQQSSWSVWKINHCLKSKTFEKMSFPWQKPFSVFQLFSEQNPGLWGGEHSSTSSLFRPCYLPLLWLFPRLSLQLTFLQEYNKSFHLGWPLIVSFGHNMFL